MAPRDERLRQEVRHELISEFKAMGGKEGAVLSPDWLYNDFLPSLSPKEEQAVEEVISQLLHEGMIAFVPGRRPTYKLTARGSRSFETP